MKVRKVCPQKVEQAKAIMAMVCEVMNVSLESVLSTDRNGKLPYVRKLIIYAIRNEVSLQVDVIASFFGWLNTKRLVSTYYVQIKDWYRLDERVRADVNKINNALKVAA